MNKANSRSRESPLPPPPFPPEKWLAQTLPTAQAQDHKLDTPPFRREDHKRPSKRGGNNCHNSVQEVHLPRARPRIPTRRSGYSRLVEKKGQGGKGENAREYSISQDRPAAKFGPNNQKNERGRHKQEGCEARAVAQPGPLLSLPLTNPHPGHGTARYRVPETSSGRDVLVRTPGNVETGGVGGRRRGGCPAASWLGLLLLLLCFQDNEVSGTAIVHFRGSALDGTA